MYGLPKMQQYALSIYTKDDGEYVQHCNEASLYAQLPIIFYFVVALQALKRKKRYEKQLTQIDGSLSTIEFQREALENASTNTEVLKSMKHAAHALQVAHKDMYV